MKNDPDMLEEYDFSNGIRGKYASKSTVFHAFLRNKSKINLEETGWNLDHDVISGFWNL